ncbi:MAG: GNAT family N-acetyltransferase [Gammaproteobacteria bacterium]|nr:GNAT family N-acetyltransferase [Gammaproteobacteria bacterium]
MNGLVIRPLRSSDEARWRFLWQGYLEFYATRLADEVTAGTWRRLLEPSEPLWALVAEEDGELAGFAHCVLHPGTWSLARQCYLEDLYVAPPARGRGVGGALIAAVYRAADALGADRVYWLTHETNRAARALYDRVAQRSGFIHYTR